MTLLKSLEKKVGRRRSGIPRSTTSSREPSPHRFGGGAQTPTMNARGGVDRRGSTPKRPLMTEHILRQSREAETALEDALVSQHVALFLCGV